MDQTAFRKTILLCASIFILSACGQNFGTGDSLSTSGDGNNAPSGGAPADPLGPPGTPVIPGAPVIPGSPTTGNPPTTTPPTNPGTGTPPVNNTGYVPLVGYTANGSATDSAFRNFKQIYHPNNLMLTDLDSNFAPGVKCYVLQTRHLNQALMTASSATRFRVFVPPGTKRFLMISQTYYDMTTRQALAIKMDSPPTSTYDQALTSNFPIYPNIGRSLEMMIGGQELRSYVGESGNAMPRVEGGSDYSVTPKYIYQTPRGAWMYVNHLKVIGGIAMSIETRGCVDADVYRAWYNSAQWDADGNPI